MHVLMVGVIRAVMALAFALDAHKSVALGTLSGWFLTGGGAAIAVVYAVGSGWALFGRPRIVHARMSVGDALMLQYPALSFSFAAVWACVAGQGFRLGGWAGFITGSIWLAMSAYFLRYGVRLLSRRRPAVGPEVERIP